jgi:Tfp pilus assembly protein PilZ
MTEERRRHRRLAGPYDGNWNGSAGTRDCRILDLNAGGCFIDAFARPEAGASVTITVVVAGQRFALPGTVVYVDPVQGFGVRFDETDATRQLAGVIDTLPS